MATIYPTTDSLIAKLSASDKWPATRIAALMTAVKVRQSVYSEIIWTGEIEAPDDVVVDGVPCVLVHSTTGKLIIWSADELGTARQPDEI